MPSAVNAARLLCQEARVVLTSLRSGPPHIARGELAQDLMELRDRIPLDLERHLNNVAAKTVVATEDADEEATEDFIPLHPPGVPFRPSMDYSRPFLAVVTDPRASGPHTAVALQSIRRLLQNNVLPVNEIVTRGILGCKFEQTNAGQDEAVEMAIADVLCLLLQMGGGGGGTSQENILLDPQIVHEAFHTVFLTRNTFVHSSPALGYHLEDVLVQMVEACQGNVSATRVILEFVLHQLLNTPLAPMMRSSGSSVDSLSMDETTTRETQAANDAIRVLCLRLVRLALEPWQSEGHADYAQDETYPKELLPLIQDDLCLSLLMTGQAIWHLGGNHHATIGSGSGGGVSSTHHMVSPAVLTEICATIIFLWNCKPLRPHLMVPFEAIWTGFYTRALTLLRRRREPVNAAAYHANLVFDAEVEVILESLVDLFHLHDHSQPVHKNGGVGALETMFVFYDCHLHRSDVAIGLYVELCRACGGVVNDEGFPLATPPSSATNSNNEGPPLPGQGSDASSLDDMNDDLSAASSTGDPTTSLVQVDHPWRPVPPHLKELCAVAIMGCMKCLFRDDKAHHKLVDRPSAIEHEDGTCGAVVEEEDPATSGTHILKTIKSQKRFMRKAARIFNQKPSRGIEFLLDCGLMSEPISPLQVANFLRHAVVVGLDKAAVGSYLGEAGKSSSSSSPSATTSSPPVWGRDWFHKECLEAYCGLFSFQEQSLLDSLRMFLAAFRLPGEAQQIDRILQAFADKCAALCQEAPTLLSKDPKRASDAAYLLSFSIIMLNTDQHNSNIRADRKMSVDDFVKNNTDYGRDITEPGKELPRDYLVAIYDSIREEEIRTEGEGAEGAMTVERWKDVLRQANAAASHQEGTTEHETGPLAIVSYPSEADGDDLTELILVRIRLNLLHTSPVFELICSLLLKGSYLETDFVCDWSLLECVRALFHRYPF